jgi:hypothetical protein
MSVEIQKSFYKYLDKICKQDYPELSLENKANFGDNGIIMLSQYFMTHNLFIPNISLKNCNITSKGIKKFVEALLHVSMVQGFCFTINNLCLKGNPIGKENRDRKHL